MIGTLSLLEDKSKSENSAEIDELPPFSQVLHLYREMLRVSRPLDPQKRLEVRTFARQEFESMRSTAQNSFATNLTKAFVFLLLGVMHQPPRTVKDRTYIKQLIKDGARQVEHIEHLRNMTF